VSSSHKKKHLIIFALFIQKYHGIPFSREKRIEEGDGTTPSLLIHTFTDGLKCWGGADRDVSGTDRGY
jgi:hypothetical protein